MTEKQLLELTSQLAALSTALAGGLALVLWRQGMMPDDATEAFGKRLRDAARALEDAGFDGPASELWTVANLLERQPPKGRG